MYAVVGYSSVSTCTRNLKCLVLLFSKMWLAPQNLNVSYVTLTTPPFMG